MRTDTLFQECAFTGPQCSGPIDIDTAGRPVCETHGAAFDTAADSAEALAAFGN